MKYFLNPETEELYAYDDDCDESFIAHGLVPLTDDQYFARLEVVKPKPGVDDFKVAIQAHMDSKAVAMGYSNLLSAISYADEPSVERFQAEGREFRRWRSEVWDYCSKIFMDFEPGKSDAPTIEGLIEKLPKVLL